MLSNRDLILPDKGILYKGVVIILDKFSHLGSGVGKYNSDYTNLKVSPE